MTQVTISGKLYDVAEGDGNCDDCEHCAFDYLDVTCLSAPCCTRFVREDGKNVYFVEVV